jgi:hypothetical protein
VTRSPSPRTAFAPRVITIAAAASVLALVVAGCGGGGSPGVATVASSTTAAKAPTQNGTMTTRSGRLATALAFARCMRSHGIPNWPDPTSDGGFDKSKLRQLDVSEPRITALEDTLCHFTFGGGPASDQQSRIQLADELSFARCMRSHGVTRFPDPTAQSAVTLEMVQAQGIDLHSPAVLRVVTACLPASHGGLTPAKVGQALNHTEG